MMHFKKKKNNRSYKRKTGLMLVMVVSFVIFVDGCGTKSSKISESNKVEDTIQQQIAAQSEADTEADSVSGTELTDSGTDSVSETGSTDTEADSMPGTGMAVASDVDYDLTQMNSDLVYATVYQLMMDPDTYIGKTVRMRGTYYAEWYEATQKYYYYVIISDAIGCCSQGMEFIWEDGSHVYPDEYPEDGATVEVTGTFETYQEEGDSNLYCRLKDATMTVTQV